MELFTYTIILIWLFAFIMWFIMSIMVAVAAERRRRSALGFFFISFILSPLFGVILVLMLREKKVPDKWDL
jgi:hypothetical protein